MHAFIHSSVPSRPSTLFVLRFLTTHIDVGRCEDEVDGVEYGDPISGGRAKIRGIDAALADLKAPVKEQQSAWS